MATITWLGHAGFLIEAGQQKLVIDGWLRGPTYPGTNLADV
jgi:L-ascorbate metabolism protein UlaG (beta-lactamase superfamily)